MSPRLCACGCGRSMVGRSMAAEFFDGSHRQRAHRRKVADEMRAAGLPAHPSLRAAKTATESSERNGDAQNARNGGQARSARRTRTPDRRVGLAKAVDEVAGLLERAHGVEPLLARRQAEDALRRAMTERQRQALAEARRAA